LAACVLGLGLAEISAVVGRKKASENSQQGKKAAVCIGIPACI
jgi:hypothetical protein